VPGFTTIILVILFFSGVQLISLGILSEYLSQIYQESKMWPPYVIKEVQHGNLTASIKAKNQPHDTEK
jgi:hypothetical protein